MSLCLGLVACGDDKEDNVVPPATNNTQQGNTSQTLPDPEGTVTARITNDGNYKNGIKIEDSGHNYYEHKYHYIYMDNMNNICIKRDGSSFTPSIVNVGRVSGLSAITIVPTNGFTDEKVAASEGDGFVIRDYGQRGTSGGLVNMPLYGYQTICRMYLASFIRDAFGNITGATIKYQTGSNWVEKEE